MSWRKFGQNLLFPPVWLTILLVPVSAAALVYVFVNGYGEHPLSSVAYAVSFYTLTVFTAACIKRFPGYYRRIRQAIYNNRFGNRLMTDTAFKTNVSLYRSLAINLLFAAFNLVSGIYYHTAWFLIFAVYYTILAVMRFVLVRYASKHTVGSERNAELRPARLCASILLTVNLALTAAVLMILYRNRGFTYHGILIYVMALYTFYCTVSAVVAIIRSRKYASPVLSMTKVISLAAALVSMLSLETAMLAAFGAEMPAATQRIFIAATGAGVSAVIVTMSVYVIVKSNRALRASNETGDS